jgi:hypothetical protein
MVVGVKPGRRIKLWCEPVDGHLPSDVWDAFVDLLQGAGEKVWPTVTEPVACALECVLGTGPPEGFPDPASSVQASPISGPALRHHDRR